MVALLLALILPSALAAPPGLVPDARFDLSLWCAPTCEEASLERLDKALESIELGRSLPRAAKTPARVAGLAPAQEYGRPEAALVGDLPGDLGETGASVLASSEKVVVSGFSAPVDQALPVLRQAYAAFAALARETGGVVEEIATGRYFCADAFERHAGELAADPVDVTRLFVIETQEEDEGSHVLSTWGLRAVGLQELQVSEVPTAQLDDMEAVLNTLAQVAFEKGSLSSRTELSEAVVSLPSARRRAVGIEGVATASWKAPRDDPGRSPVVEVSFEGRFDAPPLTPPMEATPEPVALALEPEPVPATLAEAKAEAARHLAGPVREAFAGGLPPGDTLYVKAPFEAGQGRIEYLWIAVTGWEGEVLEGTLRSEPAWAEGIAPGDRVEVPRIEVFDWLLRHADGTSEGNETERFLDTEP
ncbi:MAG: DUF2314 domain-containing protein [Deltaproteobacteria bacterium]|nr:DUF2314 domain-containing protein [Deltaproteobacteria bacterium]